MPEKLRCKYCSSFKHSEFWNVRKCKQNHFASCSEWQQIPTTVFYYNNHTHSQWPKTVFLFFTFALLIFHLCSSLNVKKHLRYMSICQHLTADGNNDSPCCITCRHCVIDCSLQQFTIGSNSKHTEHCIACLCGTSACHAERRLEWCRKHHHQRRKNRNLHLCCYWISSKILNDWITFSFCKKKVRIY